jgi:hypothetical protein
MDSVTQQNAALVQQTSSSASALEGQARQLAELMATFRIDESATGSAALTHAPDTQAQNVSNPKEPAPRQPAAQGQKAPVDEWDEF